MSSEPSPTNSDTAGLREQMLKLQALHADGVIAEAAYQDARAALERRIVDAVLRGTPAAAAPERLDLRWVAGLALGVLVIAGLGYAWRGSPSQAWSAGTAAAPAAALPAPAASAGSHPITSGQIESMIGKLEARLKDKPDDPDGWAMLGRAYAMLGKHDLALPALKRASQGRPTDAALVADVADATAVVAGGNLDGEPAQLIDKALKLDPDNPKALTLAGTVAFNRKDYAAALRHWEHLVAIAPGSDFAKQIQGGIDEARSLLPAGAEPAASLKTTPAMAAEKTAIHGTVTLAKALAGRAAPEDTLFVFARAAEGPRMPLAIVRKQVKDLPFSFTLDDSLAMSPAMKLSSAPRVVVGARISKRGDASVQPGDLQGLSAPMVPGASGVTLEISEVVRP